MRTGRTRGAVVFGVRAHLVDVEVQIAQGLPQWAIVGLPDASVNEARDRVRAAVAATAIQWPNGRVTVGLGPASLPKRGAGLDLAIAVALLCAAGEIPDPGRVADWVKPRLGLLHLPAPAIRISPTWGLYLLYM